MDGIDASHAAANMYTLAVAALPPNYFEQAAHITGM